MGIAVILLVLLSCQPFRLVAQQLPIKNATAKTAALPTPSAGLTVGTWKYTSREDIPRNAYAINTHSTFSVTVKDDGGAWTVTTSWEFPEGPVTDVSTLDKGTLILRKETFTHFLHRDQPWKPVAVDLDFKDNTVHGVMRYVNRPDKPVTVDLSGPLFSFAPDLTAGALPLTNGYSATLRYFDVERLALNPQSPDKEKHVQLKVLGSERVTVPAGTFDSWRIELTSPDSSYKETAWIAKDSRVPVKTYTIEIWSKGARKGSTSSTTEMVR